MGRFDFTNIEKSFLKRRTILQIFGSFDRLWIFLFLVLWVLFPTLPLLLNYFPRFQLLLTLVSCVNLICHIKVNGYCLLEINFNEECFQDLLYDFSSIFIIGLFLWLTFGRRSIGINYNKLLINVIPFYISLLYTKLYLCNKCYFKEKKFTVVFFHCNSYLKSAILLHQ